MHIEIAGVKILAESIISIGPGEPRERPGFGMAWAHGCPTAPPLDPPRTRIVYMSSIGPRVVDTDETIAGILTRLVT